MGGLSSCTDYHLYIYPTYEKELMADSTTFRTKSPSPLPPSIVNASFNEMTNKVDIRWSPVRCATGYKVHQKLEDSDTSTDWTESGLSAQHY